MTLFCSYCILQHIELDFSHFNIEFHSTCAWDSFAIYDITDYDGDYTVDEMSDRTSLEKRCGTMVSHIYVAPSKVMVVLKTDHLPIRHDHSGFSASVRFVSGGYYHNYNLFILKCFFFFCKTPILLKLQDLKRMSSIFRHRLTFTWILDCILINAADSTFSSPNFDGSTPYEQNLQTCWIIEAPNSQVCFLRLMDV